MTIFLIHFEWSLTQQSHFTLVYLIVPRHQIVQLTVNGFPGTLISGPLVLSQVGSSVNCILKASSSNIKSGAGRAGSRSKEESNGGVQPAPAPPALAPAHPPSSLFTLTLQGQSSSLYLVCKEKEKEFKTLNGRRSEGVKERRWTEDRHGLEVWEDRHGMLGQLVDSVSMACAFYIWR